MECNTVLSCTIASLGLGGAKRAPNRWLCDQDGMVTDCYGDRVASAKFLTGTDMPFFCFCFYSWPPRRSYLGFGALTLLRYPHLASSSVPLFAHASYSLHPGSGDGSWRNTVGRQRYRMIVLMRRTKGTVAPSCGEQ